MPKLRNVIMISISPDVDVNHMLGGACKQTLEPLRQPFEEAPLS